MEDASSTKMAHDVVDAKPKQPSPGVNRRNELVEIAGELFAEKGFLATTIRDIAEKAGIQSGSLYHHFDSKESLADELIQGYWSDLIASYEQITSAGMSATDEARKLIYQSVLLLESREIAVRMSTNDYAHLARIFPYMGASLDRCEEIWITTLKRGIQDGEFSSLVDPMIMYRTIMAAIGGTARWWRSTGPIPITEIATQISDLFMFGIVKRD